MNITLEKLTKPGDLSILENMISTRIHETVDFQISLEKIDYINLANFTALIKLYVKLTRIGKNIKYINCSSEKIRFLIHKTQFHTIFSISK